MFKKQTNKQTPHTHTQTKTLATRGFLDNEENMAYFIYLRLEGGRGWAKTHS